MNAILIIANCYLWCRVLLMRCRKICLLLQVGIQSPTSRQVVLYYFNDKYLCIYLFITTGIVSEIHTAASLYIGGSFNVFSVLIDRNKQTRCTWQNSVQSYAIPSAFIPNHPVLWKTLCVQLLSSICFLFSQHISRLVSCNVLFLWAGLHFSWLPNPLFILLYLVFELSQILQWIYDNLKINNGLLTAQGLVIHEVLTWLILLFPSSQAILCAF